MQEKNEKPENRIVLFRSQVSPHLAFNVLNNMVAMARKKVGPAGTIIVKAFVANALHVYMRQMSSVWRYPGG